MLHGFLAERSAAKLPGLAGNGTPAAIEQVAILGAGTMGASIAMACANAGLRVSLSDGSTEALTRGFSTIQRSYQSSVDRGRLTAAAAAERFARIRSVSGYDGCASADLVIEAVYENMTIKKEVFGEIGRQARPGAILASNTSTLDIDQLGAVSGVPESVDRPAFLQPGPRDAARRDRARRGHGPRRRRGCAPVREAPLQGGRGRAQRAGLRRQPHHVPVHVRGAVPGRGRRLAGAGGPGAHGLRHGDGDLRGRRHGRARRRLARPQGAAPVRGRGRAQAPRRRPAGRAGPSGSEGPQGLVPLRRGSQADPGSRGDGARGVGRPREPHRATARSPARRSSSGRSTRS